MKDLNVLALDLEYNQPSKKIIQVGWIIGNIKTGSLLVSRECDIKVDEKINPYITELTGITDEDVESGYLLDDVYREMTVTFNRFNCFRDPITWGSGDSLDLMNELGLDSTEYLFGRRWIDAKTIFVTYCHANDMKHQSGLAKSMTRLGLRFKGTKHTANDDAKNTFYIYRELLKRLINDTN